MISLQTAAEFLLALPGVSEKDHFGSRAFSANGRIFATLWSEQRTLNFRFSPELQREFLAADEEAFEEIDNAWGKQGWTKARLESMERATFQNALKAAYEYSAVKSPSFKKKAPAKKAAPKNKPLRKKPVAKEKTSKPRKKA